MWKLGLWPRNSFSGNISFEFSVLVLCSSNDWIVKFFSLMVQMLDLKLALYLPFLEIMQPGVFITASDDIEVFNIDMMPAAGGKKL
jgi:hypothetical protein